MQFSRHHCEDTEQWACDSHASDGVHQLRLLRLEQSRWKAKCLLLTVVLYVCQNPGNWDLG